MTVESQLAVTNLKLNVIEQFGTIKTFALLADESYQSVAYFLRNGGTLDKQRADKWLRIIGQDNDTLILPFLNSDQMEGVQDNG